MQYKLSFGCTTSCSYTSKNAVQIIALTGGVNLKYLGRNFSNGMASSSDLGWV
jgi:hypothetical protein